MTDDGYNNYYDQVLSFFCGEYNALNSIRSRHDNGVEDRQYALSCRQVTDNNFDYCYWTASVNGYQSTFDFSCPRDAVMRGMHSTHDNHFEDRVWRYECCFSSNHYTKSCEATNYLNDFDQEFSFGEGGDRVLIGAQSYFEGWAR